MEKIFACKECGQVYRIEPPEKCMRHKCNSVEFERIEEKDVINIHDVPQLLFEISLEKLFGIKITIKTD